MTKHHCPGCGRVHGPTVHHPPTAEDRVAELLHEHRMCRVEGHECAVYEAAYLALQGIAAGRITGVVCGHGPHIRCVGCAIDDDLDDIVPIHREESS